MPFAAIWMNLKIIILSEVSYTEKEKYCMIALIRGIQNISTNEFIYKMETFIDTENKLTITKEEKREMINQDYGINRYTRSYIKTDKQ